MLNLKQRYNKWLFHKYGFVSDFKNIPWIYRVNLLFSPALYFNAGMGETWQKGFEERLKSITKKLSF